MTVKKRIVCINQAEILHVPEFQPDYISSSSFTPGEVITLPVITIIVHSAENGGFWIKVPQLPGCYSQAESEDDVHANALEAINGYLSSFDNNDPAKPPYDVNNFILWITFE
ncbi:MAG: type II toxin-antitoxin system HicB family antitoxin [Candidatus Hodarchaeales archaeon]